MLQMFAFGRRKGITNPEETGMVLATFKGAAPERVGATIAINDHDSQDDHINDDDDC